MPLVYYKGEKEPRRISHTDVDHDRLHREDGPAVIYSSDINGDYRRDYRLNGLYFRQKEWIELVSGDRDRALQTALDVAYDLVSDDSTPTQSRTREQRTSYARRIFEFLAEKGYISDVDVFMENLLVSL